MSQEDRDYWFKREERFKQVQMACECGNSFSVPYDCAGFMYDTYCGQCGEQGKITPVVQGKCLVCEGAKKQ